MYTSSYYPTLVPTYYLIHDKPFTTEEERLERLRFHVNAGDYFLMLAQALGFVEEKLVQCEDDVKASESSELSLVHRLRSDLRQAHKHFTISEREDGEGGTGV